jgi:hypothetical protein
MRESAVVEIFVIFSASLRPSSTVQSIVKQICRRRHWNVTRRTASDT